MKKLLTCLFALLMAIALVSPVGMKAQGGADTHTVTIVLVDSDLKLVNSSDRITRVNCGSTYDVFQSGYDAILEYTGKDFGVWGSSLTFDNNSNATIEVTVTYVDDNGDVQTLSNYDTAHFLSGTNYVTAGYASAYNVDRNYVVYVSLTLDYLENGEAVAALSGDTVDDRTQTIYTFKVEGWHYYKETSTGWYTSTEYVADDEDTLVGIILNHAEFYTIHEGADGVEYTLVFHVDEDAKTVTATWTEVTEGMKKIVWESTSTSTTVCEDGTEWDADAAKCLPVDSSNTVTIPDTATK